MIKLIFLIITMVLSILSYAQQPREISDPELEKIKLEVDSIAEINRSEKQRQSSRHCVAYCELELAFEIDTFKIAEIQRRQLEIDYSTAGMLNSCYEAQKAYDILLNKYYKSLLYKLKPEGAKMLKNAQRNWLTYRDAEIELIYNLPNNMDSGVGTLHSVICANQIQELTKKRVVELFEYLRLLQY